MAINQIRFIGCLTIKCLVIVSLVNLGCNRKLLQTQNLNQKRSELEFWYHSTYNPVTISAFSWTVTYHHIEAILCGRLERDDICKLILHIEPGMDISVTYPLLDLAVKYKFTDILILRNSPFPDEWVSDSYDTFTSTPDYINEIR